MSNTNKIATTLEELWNSHKKKERTTDFNIIVAIHESLMINNIYINNFDWGKICANIF